MNYQSENNKINKTIETTLKNISNLIDTNTVIGKPIKTEDGELIFPVSKVTIGVLSGGGEYGKINIFSKNKDLPFSAGNGAIISIKPSGFFIKNGKKYSIISTPNTPYEKLIEKTADFLSQYNNGKDN